MKCLECGKKTKVLETRHYRDTDKEFEWVERRHACMECNWRMFTVEVPRFIWTKYVENVREDNE